MGAYFYDESPNFPTKQRPLLGPDPPSTLAAGIASIIWAGKVLSIDRVPVYHDYKFSSNNRSFRKQQITSTMYFNI